MNRNNYRHAEDMTAWDTIFGMVQVDPSLPPDTVQFVQDNKVVGTIVNLEVPVKDQPLSIEALKANLFFATAKKHKAFEEHKKAIVEEHKAITDLNNALRRIPF